MILARDSLSANDPKRTFARVLARALYKDMSEHKVTLKWERGGAEFSYQKYPRDNS